MSEYDEGWNEGRQLGRDIEERQQRHIASLEATIAKMLEDIRGACGCTDGDDIRGHLKDYLDA